MKIMQQRLRCTRIQGVRAPFALYVLPLYLISSLGISSLLMTEASAQSVSEIYPLIKKESGTSASRAILPVDSPYRQNLKLDTLVQGLHMDEVLRLAGPPEFKRRDRKLGLNYWDYPSATLKFQHGRYIGREAPQPSNEEKRSLMDHLAMGIKGYFDDGQLGERGLNKKQDGDPSGLARSREIRAVTPIDTEVHPVDFLGGLSESSSESDDESPTENRNVTNPASRVPEWIRQRQQANPFSQPTAVGTPSPARIPNLNMGTAVQMPSVDED